MNKELEFYDNRILEKLQDKNGLYDFAMELNDIKKIDKLMTIKNIENFYDNVRKFTKNVYSDKSISRWQCLAELRYAQLLLTQNA